MTFSASVLLRYLLYLSSLLPLIAKILCQKVTGWTMLHVVYVVGVDDGHQVS